MPNPDPASYRDPIRVYSTPSWGEAPVDGISVVDELIVETIDPNGTDYVRLPEGSPHPDIVRFPNHKLIAEKLVQFGVNQRYWGNGYRNEDQYNYEIAYSGESNAQPIFTRKYLERRDSYAPLLKESRFTGVYLIQVTNEGSGYDPDSPPTITISGGGGAGATARGLVSSDGKLKWIYLTNEGSGYTTIPTVTVGSGTATAVAKVNLDTQVVISVTITAGGTGYVVAPTITFSGGGGAGTSAVAQISGGIVKAISMTAYGSGYTSAPSVTFSSGAATGTAVLETASMRLVKEDVAMLPEDDPRRSLYVQVVRTYETAPGPILIEHQYEPFIDAYVAVQKRIVFQSQVPADMYWVARVPGQITEYQPLSKHRSIQIISKVNPLIAIENGGQGQEYTGTVNYTFPNYIEDDPVIDVYFAYSGDNLQIDFGWRLNVKEGYSGPCEATFTRIYTFDPNNATFLAALPEVTYIRPQSDVINNGFVFVGGNLIARATQFVIPSTLHPELNVDVEGTSPPVNNLPGPVATVEATEPTSIPPGTIIVVSVNVRQYRFGLWYADIVKIVHPSPPA